MILITGCAGYIGRRLAEALQKKGCRIRGLVLPGQTAEVAGLSAGGMEIWIGDLLIPATLCGIGEGVTRIVHLAGIHASVGKMEQLYVEGARNLIKACRDVPPDICMIASNHAVYGGQGDLILNEAGALHPDHPFGEITLKMERAVQRFYQTDSFPAIILRIAEVYGPEQYNLISSLKRNPLTLLGDGSNYSSRIHIDDLIAILTLGPDRLSPGDVYNVCDDLPVTQRQLFTELSETYHLPLPKYIPIENVPERIRLGIHGLRALSLRVSNAKLKQRLNLKLQYPTYREGMKALVDLA
jgi:nucleoside-diphosphate-sugar epimerase